MENFEMQQSQEQEIDLLEVFHVLWGKVWLLILSLIVGVMLSGAGTYFLITPQYKATSTIYILSKTTSITSLADLQIGSSLAADFQIIATTREVVNVVIDDLDIEEDYETFVKSIEVTNPTNSHMLQITVTNPDPELAARASNALADQLRMQIAEVMSTDTPSTVSRAQVPTEASSPSMKVNCAVGGIVCVAIAAGLILLGHFMDDTIKDEEDVSRYLGIDTLAAIPLEHSGNTSASAGKSGRSGRSSSSARYSGSARSAATKSGGQSPGAARPASSNGAAAAKRPGNAGGKGAGSDKPGK